MPAARLRHLNQIIPASPSPTIPRDATTATAMTHALGPLVSGSSVGATVDSKKRCKSHSAVIYLWSGECACSLLS